MGRVKAKLFLHSSCKWEGSNVTFFNLGRHRCALYTQESNCRHYEYVSLYSECIWLKWDKLLARNSTLWHLSFSNALYNFKELVCVHLKLSMFCLLVISLRSWSEDFGTWSITSPIICTVTSVALYLRGTNSSFPSSSAAIFSCKF